MLFVVKHAKNGIMIMILNKKVLTSVGVVNFQDLKSLYTTVHLIGRKVLNNWL